jgi:hypothetical protein
MADFDQIKDVVLTYADKYADEFRKNAPRDTGRLANSYRASVTENGGKFQMQIFGEYYGPFVSYGVGPGPTIQVPPGVNPRPLNNNTYQFKTRSRGIEPNPFMQTALQSVTPKFGKALEEAGVKDIENFFDSLSKIEVE